MTAFGANIYDLFWDYLKNPTRTARSPYVRLMELKAANLKFVRFPVSPFWPDEWDAYFNDKANYLQRVNDVHQSAMAAGVMAFPTLVWYPWGVSDRFGETFVDGWTNSDSKTIAGMQDFIGSVVPRCNSARFLEVFNESSQNTDVTPALSWMPSATGAAGPALTRPQGDFPTTLQWRAALAQVASIIRKVNPTIRLSSGNGLPRFDASRRIVGDTGADDQLGHTFSITAHNYAGNQITSVHLYPENYPVNSKCLKTTVDFVKTARAAADRAGNALYIGEFGLRSTDNDVQDQADFATLLDGIKRGGADFAALWVYDYAAQAAWNVSASARPWQLAAAGAANSV